MNDKTEGTHVGKKLIKNAQVTQDPWCYKSDSCDLEHDEGSNCIVPLAYWQQNREMLLQKNKGFGVTISGSTDLFDSELLKDLSVIDVIAIEFSDFTDGRGFSLAAQLRQEGFTRELRATGRFLLDQLNYLQRSGFDAFEIEPEADVNVALSAFSRNYQTG